MAERITSRTNPLMTHIRKLASSRSHRYETGEFLGDGTKLLEEAARWGAALTAAVYTPGTALPPLPEGVRLVEVPADVMRSISPMEAPQGALFLARIPAQTLPDTLPGGRYLALEGVQDPGNVGTILRTADAFGADGLILLPGCADLYSHKTVRSSMGAVFRLPVYEGALDRAAELLSQAGVPLYAAALREDTVDVRAARLDGAAVVIGSEGRGVSRRALELCQKTVKIPMRARCESLNAAVAAAVVLWEMARGD